MDELSENSSKNNPSPFPIWCRFADFLLSQLQSDDIELIQGHRGESAKPLAEAHFHELEEAMEYAKWVRPLALLTLFTAIGLLMIQYYQLSLLVPSL